MHTGTQLMEHLASPENLLSAWRAIRGNIPRYRRMRAAGPDGVSLEEYERDLPAQLNALRHMLLKDTYQPEPPGVFKVEKRNGGERQIALLNVRDRVAQRAAQQVIEPIWEPTFLPCSFGFRPGRSVQDAVSCARELRAHGYRWVVDGDIAACFDSLDHDLLVHAIARKISDERLINLVQRWLGVGIMRYAHPGETDSGLSSGLKRLGAGTKKGFEWIMDALGHNPDGLFNDPAPYSPRWDGDASLEDMDDPDPTQDAVETYQPYAHAEVNAVRRRNLLRQMTASGLILGAGWAKPALTKIGGAAIGALRTPAGRQLLKQGLLAGGGVAGAAAGVAIAAYFVYRRIGPVGVGVLQGSPLSPILANIYLHSFDLRLTHAHLRLVRFADDWVILCPNREAAEQAYNQAILALSRIHLKINPEKTAILEPQAPLRWLGQVVE